MLYFRTDFGTEKTWVSRQVFRIHVDVVLAGPLERVFV